MRKLVMFGLVGSLGFVVDAGVLQLLKGMLGLYWARVPSFVAAVLTTWLFNRTFTFGAQRSGLPAHREFLAYLALMLGGAVVNYSVYAALVSRFALVHANPVAGVAAGSIAGLCINLLSANLLLFRRGRAS